MIGKVDYLARGANPRFVVTSLSEAADARHLYEDVSCARGDRENQIKEPQLDLLAGRTNRLMMQTNQLPLSFSSFAYALTQACRQKALTGTHGPGHSAPRSACHG